jgi:hypothetical protein
MDNLIHIWSVLCSNSTLDRNTNNVSLFNVLEQLNVPKEKFSKAADNPAANVVVGVNCELITLWKKAEKDKVVLAEEKIELADPNNKVLGSIINAIEIPENSHRARIRVVVNGVKITVEGEYKFKISVKNKEDKNFVEMAQVPLEIKAIK